MATYGMVIDLKKCIGCCACEIACKAENATPRGVTWCKVLREERGTFPHVRVVSIPTLCNHCAQAPCEQVCPTGATYRTESGLVLVSPDKCLGCKACSVACPYQARYFNEEIASYFYPAPLTPYEEMGYAQHESGVIEKCTFCAHRLEKGLEPACVEACPAEARYFGDLDNPENTVTKLVKERGSFQLLAEMGTDPHVYYLSV